MISPAGGDGRYNVFGRLGPLDCLSIGLVTSILTSALTSILDVGSALSFVRPVLSLLDSPCFASELLSPCLFPKLSKFLEYEITDLFF